MPQATDELRLRWSGDQGVGDDKALKHLAAKGFHINRGGVIYPPARDFDWQHDTEDTWGAVCFLCDEWDYAYDEEVPGP